MRSAFSVIVFSLWAPRQADESSPPEMNPGQARPDRANASEGDTGGRRAKGTPGITASVASRFICVAA